MSRSYRPHLSFTLLALGLYLLLPAAPCPAAMQRPVSLRVVESYDTENPFVAPEALAVDPSSGEVYVADPGAHAVFLFTWDGYPEFIFRDAKVSEPAGLALDGSRNLLISDRQSHALSRYDFRGKLLERVEIADPINVVPGRMDIDKDGNLFVVDAANYRLLSFDRQMRLRFQTGSYGREPGHFEMPTAVFCGADGHVAVTDGRGVPLQVFDRDGHCIFSFGVKDMSAQGFTFPRGLCIDEESRFWVADAFQHAVKVYSPKGHLLHAFGGDGMLPGMTFFPSDIRLGHKGLVYVLESGTRRLQIFRRSS